MSLYIGLMSGTSMDGIDAAIVDVTTHRLIKGMTRSYSADVKASLQKLLACEKHELRTIYQLNALIGREFGAVTNELLDRAEMAPERITAIGSHGQTIVHDAEAAIPYTVQLGCAHTIAEMTRIPVVADFRTRDLVLHGQGAPLAPLYHQALFSKLGFPLAVVNIGGIANLSVLFNDRDVIGFDVGPGNCLMDAWIMQHQGTSYDAEGRWAKQGQVIERLLQLLLADLFFKKQYPKSIGKEYFSMTWLNAFLDKTYSPVDVQATLLHLTAHLIANAILAQNTPFKKIIICGGGAHNTHLLLTLSQLVPDMEIFSSAEFDIDPDFIEAQMMAWLAYHMMTKKLLDLRSITGSEKRAVLGVFYPAGIDNYS